MPTALTHAPLTICVDWCSLHRCAVSGSVGGGSSCLAWLDTCNSDGGDKVLSAGSTRRNAYTSSLGSGSERVGVAARVCVSDGARLAVPPVRPCVLAP